MTLRRVGAASAAALVPTAARAHDAFGELGHFHGGLLHPLVDPAQGLVLVALGVLLARQPLRSVRIAYMAVLICAAVAVFAHMITPAPVPGIRSVGLVVAALGLTAMTGVALPVTVLAAMAGLLAAFAGSAGDMPEGPRAMAMAAGGSALGVALTVLLVWAVLDFLQSRVGRIAGAVAGSWLAAIGVMAAALPGVAT